MSLSNFRRSAALAFSLACGAAITGAGIGLLNVGVGIHEQNKSHAAASACVAKDGDCTRDQVRALVQESEGASREANGLGLILSTTAMGILLEVGLTSLSLRASARPASAAGPGSRPAA